MVTEPSERDWKAAAIVCREVAELPDRDACEHMTPDDMLVTGDELQPIVAQYIAVARAEGAAAERERCAGIAESLAEKSAWKIALWEEAVIRSAAARKIAARIRSGQ